MLKRVDFNAIVDHLALTHIIKSKAAPVTTRLKRLLELIRLYSYNIYYMKGKDLISSDFLSRQTYDGSNPHEIIPLSFNMYNALYEAYYSIEKKDWYLVQMWSQMRLSGISVPEVHSMKKTLDTNVLPEKQKPQIHGKQVNKNRPRLGQVEWE